MQWPHRAQCTEYFPGACCVHCPRTSKYTIHTRRKMAGKCHRECSTHTRTVQRTSHSHTYIVAPSLHWIRRATHSHNVCCTDEVIPYHTCILYVLWKKRYACMVDHRSSVVNQWSSLLLDESESTVLICSRYSILVRSSVCWLSMWVCCDQLIHWSAPKSSAHSIQHRESVQFKCCEPNQPRGQGVNKSNVNCDKANNRNSSW